MSLHPPEQYELAVLSFYKMHLDADLERPELKKYYVAGCLGLACVSLVAVVLLRHQLGADWLCPMSALGGVALAGAVFTAQSRAHFKVLRPHINADQLCARIDQLNGSKGSE